MKAKAKTGVVCIVAIVLLAGILGVAYSMRYPVGKVAKGWVEHSDLPPGGQRRLTAPRPASNTRPEAPSRATLAGGPAGAEEGAAPKRLQLAVESGTLPDEVGPFSTVEDLAAAWDAGVARPVEVPLTLADYEALTPWMPQEDAIRILGDRYTTLGRIDLPIRVYWNRRWRKSALRALWCNPDGSGMELHFRDGRLWYKQQFGLE